MKQEEIYSLKLHELLNGAFPDAPAMFMVDHDFVREHAEEIISAIQEITND